MLTSKIFKYIVHIKYTCKIPIKEIIKERKDRTFCSNLISFLSFDFLCNLLFDLSPKLKSLTILFFIIAVIFVIVVIIIAIGLLCLYFWFGSLFSWLNPNSIHLIQQQQQPELDQEKPCDRF